MKYTIRFFILGTALLFISASSFLYAQTDAGESKLKALIVDGENNHGVWPKTTMMMKDFLEQRTLPFQG